MSRDKSLDVIFLRNFFDNSVGFFVKNRPYTEDEYLHGYAYASNAWIPLKEDLDSYPLSIFMKKDLNYLFELAENFFYYVNSSDYTYQSAFLNQKWEEIRHLARKIHQQGHNHLKSVSP